MVVRRKYKQHMGKILDLWAISVLGLSVIVSIGLAFFGIWWMHGVGFVAWYAVASDGSPIGVTIILAFVLTRNSSIRLAGALTMASSAAGLLLAETYLYWLKRVWLFLGKECPIQIHLKCRTSPFQR